MIRARHSSSCRFCGEAIKRGMPIERAGFKVRESRRDGYVFTPVNEYVHAVLCAPHARAEWPELNGGRS